MRRLCDAVQAFCLFEEISIQSDENLQNYQLERVMERGRQWGDGDWGRGCASVCYLKKKHVHVNYHHHQTRLYLGKGMFDSSQTFKGD